MSNFFLDVSTAVYARLAANWTSGASTKLPVLLDNDDGKSLTLTGGFVHQQTTFADSNLASINYTNPKIRTTGVISFNIYTPQNKGVGAGQVYAGEIADIFRAVEFSDLLFYAPSIVSGQQMEYAKGSYWMTPLICPFKYDKHVTPSS